jgi:hypothetical protein
MHEDALIPVPAPEIDPETGLTVAELERESARRIALADVAADPLPGPLALAFPSQPIRVGAFAVRPVVGIDIPLLKQLDSPLLKQMAEAGKPAAERQPTQFTDQDGWEMVLLFLSPPERIEAELARGREHFRKLARELVGLAMNPVLIGMLVDAVAQQFRRTFETAVEFTGKNTGTTETNAFFTRPPATPKTASAGGSSTSPA